MKYTGIQGNKLWLCIKMKVRVGNVKHITWKTKLKVKTMFHKSVIMLHI